MPRPDQRILLVEDDRFLRRASEMGLRARGFDVTTAVDGLDGLRAVGEARPDLILLDMLMPRLDGLEMLQRLRRDPVTRDVPVIVLSNSSRESDVAESRRLGVAGYFVKADLTLQALGDAVEAFFARAAETRP